MATLILIAFLIMFIVLGVKEIQKSCNKPGSIWQKLLFKLSWWKLIVEFYVISLVFYISIRIYGLCGTDLTEILKLKENIILFEVSIFLVLPVILIGCFLITSLIMIKLPFSNQEKKYRQLLNGFLINKIYIFIVLLNMLL